MIVPLVFLLILGFLGIREKKRRTNREKEKIKAMYGKLQTKELGAEHLLAVSRCYKERKNEYGIDDITWNDLLMDKLFIAMNYTFSSAGEEYLYYRLRTPVFSIEQLDKLQDKIMYFSNHSKEREDFLLSMARCGKSGKYSLLDSLKAVEERKAENVTKHYFSIALFAFSLVMIFVRTGVGIWLLLASLTFNVSVYFAEKGKLFSHLMSLRYLMKMIRAGEEVCKMNLPAFAEEQKQLKKRINALKGLQRKGFYVFSGYDAEGSMAGVFMSYVNMVLHLDLLFYKKMLIQIRDCREEILSLSELLGFMETTVAIGSFREALPQYSVPKFKKEEKAKGIYHPLIEHAVKNDYVMKKSMLITGSNASGKSTFLRTVALNTLLAQTIYTTCSEEFTTSFHRIYSSMSLTDNLLNGESYYIAEIKAIKRIVDSAKEEGPSILCFVDEVLRGTNTVERIAASSQILKYLSESGVLCMAATHDEELTGILDAEFENYHFEEELQGETLVFRYQLLPGKAKTKNAILLLKMLSFEDTIVKEAKEMAEYFEQNNSWKRKG